MGHTSCIVLLQMMVAGAIAFVGGCGVFPGVSFGVATAVATVANLLYVVAAVKEWRLMRSLRCRTKGWLSELESQDAKPLKDAWSRVRFMPVLSWWLLPLLLGLPVVFLLMQVVLVAEQLFALIFLALALGAYGKRQAYQRLIAALAQSQWHRRIHRMRL